MPPPSVLAYGIPSRKKPQPLPDNMRDGSVFRSGRYGEEMNLSLIPKNHLLADEGSYFIASTPTPGTGIATVAAATGVPTPGANTDLNPYLVVYNRASATDGTRVYLDSLQMIVTAPGTAGTAINLAVQLDQWQNRIKPAAAVGGTLLTPVNVNMDDASQSVVQAWAGANTVQGSSGAAGGGAGVRLLPHRQFRPVIPVAGDVYCLTFGGAEQFVGSLISSGTAICQQSFNYPPVIIGPQQVALIYLWLPSQSAASSYEFDLSWWER